MAKQPVAAEKRVMTMRTLFVIVLAVGVILAFVLFSNYGVLARCRLASEYDRLHENVAHMKKSEDSLQLLIKQLETDTLVIERIARERYGYIRPGEQDFIIDRDHESNTVQRP
jgi:cell division protein FtsB